jgi:hypothetical protein
MKYFLLMALVLMPASTVCAEEGWTSLFDGKTLNGWKANENPDQWKVEDGAIVAHGPRSHLFYFGADESKPAGFKNFHFKADVMTRKNSNSGIFFHTAFQPDGWPTAGLEAQVNQTQGDPVKTGSLYNVKKNFKAPAKDDEWFTYEIIVDGKHVTTKVDGKTIVDYVEPAQVPKGTPKLNPGGTFALQAHDPGSTVLYKNLMVKRLP